jgi:hypothetical protein
MVIINGGATLFSAVCVDRAERATDGWYHGSAANWRIVATLNAVAFGLNGLAVAL